MRGRWKVVHVLVKVLEMIGRLLAEIAFVFLSVISVSMPIVVLGATLAWLEVVLKYTIPLGVVLGVAVVLTGAVRQLPNLPKAVTISTLLAVGTFLPHPMARLELLAYELPVAENEDHHFEGPSYITPQSHLWLSTGFVLPREFEPCEELLKFQKYIESLGWERREEFPVGWSDQTTAFRCDTEVSYARPHNVIGFERKILSLELTSETAREDVQLKVYYRPVTWTPYLLFSYVVLLHIGLVIFRLRRIIR